MWRVQIITSPEPTGSPDPVPARIRAEPRFDPGCAYLRDIRQLEHQQDYVQWLREKADSQFLIQRDYNAIAQVLGIGDDAGEEEPDESEAIPAPLLELDSPDEPLIVISDEPAEVPGESEDDSAEGEPAASAAEAAEPPSEEE